MPKESTKDAMPALVEGLVAALVDHHGQIDIRLQKVHVTVPGSQLGLELDGKVTVSVHLRDLTSEEKHAHVESNLAAIRA
jgi:hypothetical protein